MGMRCWGEDETFFFDESYCNNRNPPQIRPGCGQSLLLSRSFLSIKSPKACHNLHGVNLVIGVH